MATGQAILNIMEVLFPELQLQSGEGDVVKGLVCLNAAQDMFETHAAQYKDFMGGAVSSLTTSAGVEYTAFPSSLLRLDGIDFLDQGTLRPAFPLRALYRRGEQATANFWPFSLIATTNTGAPRAYWTNGTRIYWAPFPDGDYTLRTYGFSSAADITAVGTFAYPDAVMLPLAVVACKIARLGLDDGIEAYSAFATETFNPVLDLLSNYRRDGLQSPSYSYTHDT